MAESAGSGLEESTLSVQDVSVWTEDLSDLILVQRARVVNLQFEVENKKSELKQKSLESLKEAEIKLESLEALLRDAIIAHTAEIVNRTETHEAGSTICEAKLRLKSLKSRLREAIIYQGSRVRKLEGKSEKEKEGALKRQETLRADYKAVTGKEWSDVRDEGPILMTSNAVRGNEVRLELKQRLLELRRQNIISAEEKVLWMTGTHGSEDGKSALTDIDMTEHSFYQDDCRTFGIKAGPWRTIERPPLCFHQPFSDEDWKRLPDITKPAEKLNNPASDCLCNNELMKEMDIRVANMTYFYKNEEKLIRDINEEYLIY